MGMVKYLVAILLLIPCVSFAADIHCDSTTLQAAIDAAADGDTITCRAGSYTWTASPVIPATKGLTITGKGTTTDTGTLITHAAKPLTINLADANSVVDISGFKITKTASGPSITINNSNNPPVYGGDPMFRIHGNYFEDGTLGGYGGIYVSNYSYGLIDNNTFNDFGAYAIYVNYRITGESTSAREGAWAWSQPQAIGTNKAVYIENNTFATTKGASTIAISGSSGARYVARYNTITGSSISSHSGCTGGRYQPIWLESYSNQINYSASYGLLWYRTSSGIMWNNTFPISTSSTVVRVDMERSYRTDCNTTYTDVNKLCNGTVAIDGNTSEMNGWPCMGQPGYGPLQTAYTDGVLTGEGMGLGYVFSGLFAWGNTNQTTSINLRYNGTQPAQEAHMAFGRELFNTANMIIGGAKPATCSFDADVGRDIYIDTTDTTKPIVWQCSATNTWTQHWTPYTCPHPLADPLAQGECNATAGTEGYILTGGESDTTAPTVTSVYVNGATMTMTFSEPITSTADAGFSLTPSGAAVTVDCPAVSTAATSMACTISRALVQAETATYAYTDTKVIDAASNPLANIGATAITGNLTPAEAPTSKLTVNKTGSGCTVTSSPSGISFGGATASDDFEFNTNTVVTLSGYSENGWNAITYGGDCASNGTVTMNAAKECTATCTQVYLFP
jgi:hypothetical protein